MEQTLPPEEWVHIARSPLFLNCPEEEIRRALARPECSLMTFHSGQSLYRPHQFQRSLGILLSGSVRVTRDALVINTLRPGDLFGAAALFNDRADYAVTLTASTPCRAIFFPQDLVISLMDASPQVRDNYIRYLSGRIRFLSGKVQALSADGVQGKLKQYLLTALCPDQSRLECSAAELARRLGVSRASLYRAFDALEKQGLIRREGRTILVPDLSALEDDPCPRL